MIHRYTENIELLATHFTTPVKGRAFHVDWSRLINHDVDDKLFFDYMEKYMVQTDLWRHLNPDATTIQLSPSHFRKFVWNEMVDVVYHQYVSNGMWTLDDFCELLTLRLCLYYYWITFNVKVKSKSSEENVEIKSIIKDVLKVFLSKFEWYDETHESTNSRKNSLESFVKSSDCWEKQLYKPLTHIVCDSIELNIDNDFIGVGEGRTEGNPLKKRPIGDDEDLKVDIKVDDLIRDKIDELATKNQVNNLGNLILGDTKTLIGKVDKLGEYVALKNKKLEVDLSDAKEEISEQQITIKDYESRIDVGSKENDRLTKELSTLKKSAGDLQTTLNDLQKSKSEAIVKKDQEIQGLLREISTVKIQLEAKNNDTKSVEQFRLTIDDINRKLEVIVGEKNKKIDDLLKEGAGVISVKDKEIGELKAKVQQVDALSNQVTNLNNLLIKKDESEKQLQRQLEQQNIQILNQKTQARLTDEDIKRITNVVNIVNDEIRPLKKQVENLDLQSLKKSISEIKTDLDSNIKDQTKLVEHVNELTDGTIKSFEFLQTELSDQRKDMNLILEELKRISPALQTKEVVQRETPGRDDALKKQLEKMKGTLGTLRLFSRPRGPVEGTQGDTDRTKSRRGKSKNKEQESKQSDLMDEEGK